MRNLHSRKLILRTAEAMRSGSRLSRIRISHLKEQPLLFQISGKDCTFGNLITQCVYLWNLSPEGVYALHLQGSRAVFANDSAIIPFLSSYAADRASDPDCVDLVLDNFAELPCSETQLNPLETDSARNAFDLQHFGSSGSKAPPIKEFPSRLKSGIKGTT